MDQMMDYNDFAGDFGMWAEKFKPFIISQEMFNIYQKLKQDAKTNTIYPKSDVTFRSFGLTVPNNIRVVWYLMDPYPGTYFKTKLPQATGVPMDCSNSEDGKLQPTLIKFYQGIEDDLGITVEKNKDLSYLLYQGVLLLNTELTVIKDRTGSHSGLWEPFHRFLLEEILSGTTGISYVFSGENSKNLIKYVNQDSNYIFETEHPVAASYGQRKWKHDNIFTKINTVCKGNFGKEYDIMWDRKEWDDMNEPPF